jgi:hypothetical protein
MFFLRYLLLLSLCSPFLLSAQDIRIKGVVVDKESREPLPFCNIYIPQMQQGLSAGADGEFEILLSEKTDSVLFYYLGYENKVLKWRQIKRDLDSLVIEMQSSYAELQEIVITGKKKKTRDTLATRIYRGVVANKSTNRPEAYQSYEYEEYNKLVGSYYNFNPKLINRKIVRPFKFVFENYDSTADGRKYIPLIVKENIVRHSYQQTPKKEHTQTIASKVSGVDQDRFSEVLDYVFEEMDVYSNQLVLSGRGFMLPFADGALLKYRYFFLDSTENDLCEWVYHLAFAPITKGDPAFKGEVWIHAPTYAIQKIELELDPRANINFYTDFLLEQEFEPIPGAGWFKKKERRTTAITINKNSKSRAIHLEQVKSYKDIRINEPIADSVWADKNIYAAGYNKRPREYWQEARHDSLRIPQRNVYYLMDSLKTTRAYKVYSTLGRTFSSAHYRAGPIEIGSIAQLVSKNPIEGWRFRGQVRANRSATPQWRYLAYLAYGTEDERFKYGLEASYRIPNQSNFLNEIGAKYRDDYQRFSLANQEFDYDHFFNSLFRRRAFDDLVYVRDFSIFHRRQWTPTWRVETGFDYKRYKTITGQAEFTTTLPDGNKEVVSGFNLAVPRVLVSFTPGARFLQTDKTPVYLSGNLPRIYIDLSMSIKNLLGGDFNYQKIGIEIEQKIPTPIGWSRYILSASKLFGEIPYPLLHIMQGNENFVFDSRRFSNMREGEYAADQQVTLLFEHHFDGFFLNRVPLISKLQWREVFLCKMAYTSLSPDKTSFLDLPASLRGLNGYYAEIGAGIENIFKVIEVQASCRLTQKNQPDITKFAIKVAIDLSL